MAKKTPNKPAYRAYDSTFSLLRPEQRSNEISLFRMLIRGLLDTITKVREDVADDPGGTVHVPGTRE